MGYNFNFDEVIGEHAQEHNPNCPQIPDYRYRILILADLGQGKLMHYSS